MKSTIRSKYFCRFGATSFLKIATVFIFVAVMSVLMPVRLADAQTQATTQADTAITSNTPRVYVSDVTLDKKDFNAGDTITGSVTLFNGSDVDAGSVNYSFKLLGGFDTQTKSPQRMYAETNPASISIAAGNEEVVPVALPIPRNIKDDKVVVRVWVTLPSGSPLSWKDSVSFKVSGDTTLLKITDSYVKDTAKIDAYYPLQAGISLYPEKEPKNANVHIAVTNPNTKELTLTPVMTVYERVVMQGEKVSEAKLPTITLGANKSTAVSIAVPTLNYKPGLYEASIELVDSTGLNYLPTSRLRYIIQGDSAIIQSVGAKVPEDGIILKDMTIPVDIQVSGTPLDVLASGDSNATGFQMYDVKVIVKNQSGSTIASKEEQVQIGQGTTLTYNLVATKKAKSTSIFIEISKDGKVLATYDKPLTLERIDPDSLKVDGSMYVKITLLVIGIIVLLVLALAYAKRGKKNDLGMTVGIVLIIFSALSLFTPRNAPAAQFNGGMFDFEGTAYALGASNVKGPAGPSHNITISEPFENQRIPSGTPFTARGTHILNACWNVITESDGYEKVFKVPLNKYNSSCTWDMTGFTAVKGEAGEGLLLNFSGKTGHTEIFAHNSQELLNHANVLAVDATFSGKTPSSFTEYGLYHQYVRMYASHWPAPGSIHKTQTRAYACQPFWIVPATPTLTADPAKECGKVHLSWTTVPGITVYKLYRSETNNNNNFVEIAKLTNGVTTYVDSTVENGKTYFYKVTAYHEASLAESNKSNAATAYIPENCADLLAGLTCSATQSGDVVTWKANYAVANPASYTFTWTGDASGTGQTVTSNYGSAAVGTHKKMATVTVTKPGQETKANECTIDFIKQDTKVDDPNGSCTPGEPGCPTTGICTNNQVYCSTTDACVSNIGLCPRACEDPVIPVGSPLPFSAGLCAPGFEPVPTSLAGNSIVNGWKWTCRPAGTTKQSTACQSRCPTGSNFDDAQGFCVPGNVDICPNIAGIQKDPAKYVKIGNECKIPDGKIKYFVARPDTAEVECPSYWDTQVDLGAHMSCNIIGAQQTAKVGPSLVLPTDLSLKTGQKVKAGFPHTLSCDILLDEENVYIKTVTSRLRCYKPTEIREF